MESESNVVSGHKRKVILQHKWGTSQIFKRESFALALVLQFLQPEEIISIATVNKAVSEATWNRKLFGKIWLSTSKGDDKPMTFSWKTRSKRRHQYLWRTLSEKRRKWLEPLVLHLYVRSMSDLENIQLPNVKTITLRRSSGYMEKPIPAGIADKIWILCLPTYRVPPHNNFPEVRSLWLKSRISVITQTIECGNEKFPKLRPCNIVCHHRYCNFCHRNSSLLQVCAGCSGPLYCSPRCQKKDWRGYSKHSKICFSRSDFLEKLDVID